MDMCRIVNIWFKFGFKINFKGSYLLLVETLCICSQLNRLLKVLRKVFPSLFKLLVNYKNQCFLLHCYVLLTYCYLVYNITVTGQFGME